MAVVRDPFQAPPELSTKRALEAWPRQVAIVPWGRFVGYGEPAFLPDTVGLKVRMETPADLTAWAVTRQARNVAVIGQS